MNEKTIMFKRAAYIHPLGFPIAALTFNERHLEDRCAEFFLFVFECSGAVHFVPKRVWCRGIANDIISNEVLMQETLSMAQCELDIYLYTKRNEIEQSKSISIHFDGRVTLHDCTAQELLFYLIKWNQKKLADRVAEQTNSDDLRTLMSTFPRYPQPEIEVSAIE
ncbi:MAG: hypothetical protein NTV22_05890 [bacterium]|nr:hypothetical protein [bacterium]